MEKQRKDGWDRREFVMGLEGRRVETVGKMPEGKRKRHGGG